MILAGSLADSQLPAAKGTLYAVPTATEAFGIEIHLTATGAAVRSVNIYVKRSGSSSRRVIPKDLLMNPNDNAVKTIRSLSAGDLIEGDATAATEVDFTITGDLRT